MEWKIAFLYKESGKTAKNYQNKYYAKLDYFQMTKLANAKAKLLYIKEKYSCQFHGSKGVKKEARAPTLCFKEFQYKMRKILITNKQVS